MPTSRFIINSLPWTANEGPQTGKVWTFIFIIFFTHTNDYKVAWIEGFGMHWDKQLR